MGEILRLPSSDGSAYDLFVKAPEGMPEDEARRIVNAQIDRANKEDARNCEAGDGGCDDGLCVEESIKAALTKTGFEFFKPAVTFCWDELVTPAPAVDFWKEHSLHSPGWFDGAFAGQSVGLPPRIRQASEAICRRFKIRGICDPMYIANVIGVELGEGDGMGNFGPNQTSPSKDRLMALARRLRGSYGRNITAEPEDVADILGGHL